MSIPYINRYEYTAGDGDQDGGGVTSFSRLEIKIGRKG